MTEDLFHPRYPHLENLSEKTLAVLEAPELYVTEKIHGMNARLGVTGGGEGWVGTRNELITSGAQGFYDWAASRLLLIDAGVTLIGEWAGKGIQKGIDYGEKTFYLFAVLHNGEIQHPLQVVDWARQIECRTAPMIHEGPNPGLDALAAFRDGRSVVADSEREGIVIQPWPTVYDQYGHVLIVKYKSARFAERAREKREPRAPLDLTTVQGFVDDYATDTRFQHVLDQIAELGLDGLDRKNMGTLLRTMYEDVVREGADDFDALSENDQKMVGRVLNVATKHLLEAEIASAMMAATGAPA